MRYNLDAIRLHHNSREHVTICLLLWAFTLVRESMITSSLDHGVPRMFASDGAAHTPYCVPYPRDVPRLLLPLYTELRTCHRSGDTSRQTILRTCHKACTRPVFADCELSSRPFWGSILCLHQNYAQRHHLTSTVSEVGAIQSRLGQDAQECH